MCHPMYMEKQLPEELLLRPFTYQEALAEGLTRHRIRVLLESGEIERIERGLYQVADIDITEEEQYIRALKKVGEPSAVCLLSALSHYDLTDTIPTKVWLMVDDHKRIKSGYIKLYRARDPNWNVGIVSSENYSITSLERTIVDSLTHTKLVSARLGINALKQAIEEKKSTANKILSVAEELGVKHRVLPYIETLS